jgi:hypothetical protein
MFCAIFLCCVSWKVSWKPVCVSVSKDKFTFIYMNIPSTRYWTGSLGNQRPDLELLLHIKTYPIVSNSVTIYCNCYNIISVPEGGNRRETGGSTSHTQATRARPDSSTMVLCHCHLYVIIRPPLTKNYHCHLYVIIRPPITKNYLCHLYVIIRPPATKNYHCHLYVIIRPPLTKNYHCHLYVIIRPPLTKNYLCHLYVVIRPPAIKNYHCHLYVGIPAAAPKGQGNLGAKGNPPVFQGTTYQLAKFAFK